MVTIKEYERNNSWKSQVVYTSGNTNIDCSGNMAYLTVYDPDGTILLGPISGMHSDTGTYYYYVSTQSSDNLGLYICEWKSYFNYGARQGYLPKYDREVVSIVKVKHS